MYLTVFSSDWRRRIGSLNENVVGSLIWTKRFSRAGDFELTVPLSTVMAQKIHPGDIIEGQEPEGIMIVETVTVRTDINSGDYVTVSGRSIESVLEHLAPRSINPFYPLRGSYNEIVSRTLNLCYGNKLTPYPIRYISNPIFDDVPFYDGYYASDFFYGGNPPTDQELSITPLDLLSALSDYRIFPFGYTLAQKGAELQLSLYQGTDRRNDIFFSEANNNLISSEYVSSIEGYVNEVYAAAGQNPGATATDPDDGLDHSIVSMQIRRADIVPNVGEGNANWLPLCKAAGRKFIAEHRPSESFSCEIDPYKPEYGVAYNIGDIVSVFTGYGPTVAVRLVEMTYVEDENGRYYHPRFEFVKE